MGILRYLHVPNVVYLSVLYSAISEYMFFVSSNNLPSEGVDNRPWIRSVLYDIETIPFAIARFDDFELYYGAYVWFLNVPIGDDASTWVNGHTVG